MKHVPFEITRLFCKILYIKKIQFVYEKFISFYLYHGYERLFWRDQLQKVLVTSPDAYADDIARIAPMKKHEPFPQSR